MARDMELEEENQEQETTEKKGAPLKWIVIGSICLLLLGGGVFSWQSGLFAQLLGNDQGPSAKSNHKNSKMEMGPIYEMEFIVNLNEPLGKRYLKTKVGLELENEEVKAEVERRLPQFRDVVLTILSSKTFSEISDLSGKYQLRSEILAMLNSSLSSGKIRNVYFTEFIVQ